MRGLILADRKIARRAEYQYLSMHRMLDEISVAVGTRYPHTARARRREAFIAYCAARAEYFDREPR